MTTLTIDLTISTEQPVVLTSGADKVREALAQPVDAEFAARLREAVLEHEVTQRLRSL